MERDPQVVGMVRYIGGDMKIEMTHEKGEEWSKGINKWGKVIFCDAKFWWWMAKGQASGQHCTLSAHHDLFRIRISTASCHHPHAHIHISPPQTPTKPPWIALLISYYTHHVDLNISWFPGHLHFIIWVGFDLEQVILKTS